MERKMTGRIYVGSPNARHRQQRALWKAASDMQGMTRRAFRVTQTLVLGATLPLCFVS